MGAASWDDLVAAVKSHASWKRSVAMAFFPEPPESMISTECGWVRVTKGAPGYFLNTGEHIALS